MVPCLSILRCNVAVNVCCSALKLVIRSQENCELQVSETSLIRPPSPASTPPRSDRSHAPRRRCTDRNYGWCAGLRWAALRRAVGGPARPLHTAPGCPVHRAGCVQNSGHPQIAQILGCSESTVNFHFGNLTILSSRRLFMARGTYPGLATSAGREQFWARAIRTEQRWPQLPPWACRIRRCFLHPGQ